MTNNLFHFTSIYKMGHQLMKVPSCVIGRNVIQLEQVPAEVPEYADGMMTRIFMSDGRAFFAVEQYDDLKQAWDATLDSL